MLRDLVSLYDVAEISSLYYFPNSFNFRGPFNEKTNDILALSSDKKYIFVIDSQYLMLKNKI